MKSTSRSFKYFPVSVLFVLIVSISWSQDLDRKPLLGIAYDTPNAPSVDGKTMGVEVKFVFPSSSAHKAGIQKGDVLTVYNNIKITDKTGFKALISNQISGEKVKVELLRANQKLTKRMTLTEFPKEHHPDYQTKYDAVKVNDYLIRSILTIPSKAQVKHPAVFIIQGIGCGRIENPFQNMNGVSDLVTALTKQGYITMRMERSGVGDSQGPPCQEINFTTDLSHFKAGLKQLKSNEKVDPDHIYIVGISMGGIMAPILASEVEVKGMVVYGTGGRDWYSYELENTFRQALLADMPHDQLQKHMQKEQQRLHYFFNEKMTPQEIRKIDKSIGDRCEDYPMHYSYFQEVSDVDIYKIWSSNEVAVLAIHGSSDFVSSATEHQLIASMVNQNKEGTATYTEFPNSDHWLLDTPSEKSSLKKEVKGVNTALIDYMVRWINNDKKSKSL